MTKSIALIIGLVLLVVLVLFSMTYTVKYNEVAIRTRFGETDANSVVTEPGLQFRLPLFADKITTIDTRLQVRETSLVTVQTTDGQQLVVRGYMLWKVDTSNNEGALKFFESHPGGLDEANQWLADKLQTELRGGLSRYAFDDLVGAKSKLPEAENAVKTQMMQVTSRGIVPVSVGISHLLLPPNTTRAVLTRMQATRKYLSDAERYKGDAEASGIESRAYAQAEKIRAFATQRAEEIRAAGIQDAAVYIERMSQDAGLAMFLSWLDTLRSSFSEYTTYIVPTQSAPFHLFRLDTLTDNRGIPLAPDQAQPNVSGEGDASDEKPKVPSRGES